MAEAWVSAIGGSGAAPSSGDPPVARIDADPEHAERALAQLVLTLVDLLRQLMERQAIRRMEGGSLSDEEVERLGTAFRRLSERMEELCIAFDLTKEELNMQLGPLGNLL